MSHGRHFLAPLLGPDSGRTALVIDSTGRTLASAVEPAFTSKARNRGLLGRERLAPDCALVIAPSNSIHTFFMRFAIDVIYADRSGRVLKITSALGPWRISAARGGFAVIEMAAGSARSAGLQVGDRLSCVIR